ncbi:MAG TPA: glycoside hydrolase, partial [Verrucomicrobiae bacterium]
SRAGGQPANLQGIWNEQVLPPWGSKYTININTEMNYWPAEVCNLPECHAPLFAMLKDMSVTGAETAKKFYGIKTGWVAHHNTDLWRGTAPTDAARFGMWPVGGAWLCQDIWEHYAFTGDREFLATNYPVMRGAAEFLEQLLVEDPVHHWLVTPFSMSPEHGYLDAHGQTAFLSPAPTMDIGIMRELFSHCIAAATILGQDATWRLRWEQALYALPPYQIGRSGYLQEWLEDWQPAPAGHIVSPNFPFYPGNSITLHGNPELAATYAQWLSAHPPGGGFPLSWDIAMWARLERSDQVGALVRKYVENAPAQNLHNSGSNQSDASFGYTAAVAEALLQSHAGEICLLPALPPQWLDGGVAGLCARGGWVVNMGWQQGQLKWAEIKARQPGKKVIRYGSQRGEFSLQPGQTLKLDGHLSPQK